MAGPVAERPAAATTATSLRRRRTESTKTSAFMTAGWDRPLPVASPLSLDYNDDKYGEWVSRECYWRTPQRVVTLDPSQSEKQQQHKDFSWGNLLCAPIVVANQYILVASDTILSIYGNFDSDAPQESREQQRIDTKATPPLTKFSLTSDETNGIFEFGDKILQIHYSEETNIIYAFTVESCIYQLKLVLDDPLVDNQSPDEGTTKDSESKPQPKFEVMRHWVSRQLGATCMAVWSDEGGTDLIYLGYKSGHIEAWKVPQILPVDSKPRRGSRIPRKGAVLEWDGFLYDSVRTLALLPCSNKTSKDPQNESNNYLMVIVSNGPRTGTKGNEQETSSMLKILDLQQIVNAKKNQSLDSSLNHNEDNDRDLSLENYLAPQSRGMELLDASTISSSKDGNLPKRVPVLDGQGANAACYLSTCDASFTGICFPDGVVALFSRSRLDESFEVVGVTEANHQILFSYPAIGNGQFNTVGKDGTPMTCLVTCLRGGTCYLAPISTGNNEPIVAIPFPHDMESDLSDIYVQAFTAGNLLVDGVDLPVLIYAWPSGVIDVYSCGLMDSKTPKIEDSTDEDFVSRAERRCLRDMIDNDSISMVANILNESRDKTQNPLFQTKEWEELFQEFNAGKGLPASEEDLTLEALCSKQFQSLRRVLLSLALDNT